MHFLAAVVVILSVNLALGATAGPLTFPDAYYAKGNIYLPYGDIAEPFEAWVNMKTGKSRQDTYNGELMQFKALYCFNRRTFDRHCKNN